MSLTFRRLAPIALLVWVLSACAAPTPTPAPTPTSIPPTNTTIPAQIVPTATATRVPDTPAPTETNAPQAAPSAQIRDLTWTRDGKQIVTTTGDKLIVYDANNLGSFTQIEMPQEVNIVRSMPTELGLAVGISDTIRFVSTQGKFTTVALRGGTGKPSSIEQSANGRRIAAGFNGYVQGSLGNVAVWNQASGEVVNTAPVYGPVTRVAFNKEGNALLIASAVNSCGRGGGGVFVWNFSGDPELVFQINGNSVTDLAVSPTQNIAATITQHGDARCLGPAQVDVWNIDTKEIVKNFSFPQDASALAYSPNGKFLAIGTNDGVVQLIDTNTQQPTQEFQAKPGAFVRIAFSPDGKSLAAASQDAVSVWTLQ